MLASRRRLVSHSIVLVLALATAAAVTGGRASGKISPAELVASDGSPSLSNAAVAAASDVGLHPAPAGIETISVVQNEPAPAPALEDEVPAPFVIHTVAEGDTLGSIGVQYGVDVEYLIWNNPLVGADPDMLAIGEPLLVPGVPGIVYNVRLGDTVSDIAATYGIDPSVIATFAPNKLESPDMIVEGAVLVLPGGVPPPPPPPRVIEETPAPAAPDPEPATPAPAPALPVVSAPPAPAPAPARAAAAYSSGFIWPVSGPINSRFGPRWGSFHSGIDIGGVFGTGVAAAASGKVVLAAYSNYGYGNYIIIRHADGSETLYAHLSTIYVSLGQEVGQGEPIGAVGCTGWCTGPHLHFEVRIGGVAVDPLPYLP
jgi:murein DD-endopeptidase MepM/ murein hydrolase activator NlpD